MSCKGWQATQPSPRRAWRSRECREQKLATYQAAPHTGCQASRLPERDNNCHTPHVAAYLRIPQDLSSDSWALLLVWAHYY